MKTVIQIAAPESVPFNSSFFIKPGGVPLMKEKEVCALLNVSKRNLYCWRMAGLIPYIKIGRAVRFRPADVENAIQRMTAHHEPTP
jgi:excisionase family DNA binding protein